MASAGAERPPGAQEGVAVGPAQLVKAPSGRSECLEPAYEACRTPGADRCPRGHASEPELQERALKPQVEAPEEKGPRPMASPMRPGHGPKRKVEAELSPGLLLQREESEGSQSEPSPSPKQHKKAKKRKSLGAPVLAAMASTVPAPSEALGPEPLAPPWVLAGKAQRLRPLYQYINYCNPELNQAGEGDEEAKAELQPEAELALVPEEAGVEQLQALLPMAGELGSGLAMPCLDALLAPTPAPAPIGEGAGEEPAGLPSVAATACLKAEVDKSAQVDIDKMLSVCTAPLVPPLSPQYK
uniref:Chromosome 16 open reading frame 86 n=1 Tax=Oryctolagus cuniculus TaxID=9986 RepID=G1SWE3_RABIT